MKVVVGKIGLDGHDVGLRLIARQLRDAGAEVIYLGKRNTPESFASVAVQEDADAIGVASLTGGLGELTLELLDCLRLRDMADVRVVAGGRAEPAEQEILSRAGIPFFGPGADIKDVVDALLGDSP